MINKCSVYVHILPNNKLYIGVTSQTTIGRWGEHGQGYKNQQLFWRAIQKYGWNNIKHLILIDNIDYNIALLVEQCLINKYKTNDSKYGYNLTAGGEGILGYKFTEEQLQNHKNWLGKHHSEETKQKISKINKGRKHTEEYKKAISERMKGRPSPNKGKHLSEEQRQKVSERMKGKKLHCMPHSEKTKQLIGEKSRGRVVSMATREKLRQKAFEQWKRQKQLKEE